MFLCNGDRANGVSFFKVYFAWLLIFKIIEDPSASPPSVFTLSARDSHESTHFFIVVTLNFTGTPIDN